MKTDILKILIIVFFASHAGDMTADTFEEGGIAYKKGNYATAAEKFKEVAGLGDHRAMYALGSMYAGGTGVKQDYRQAFKWFSEAAKYGRLDAQYKLGLMYELGVGVKQDYRKAARYYKNTGEKGYAHGQFKFGQLFLQGKGVRQNPVKAYAWMLTARQNFNNTMPVEKETDTASADPSPENELQGTDPFADIHSAVIDNALEALRVQMTGEQIEQANELAREYIKYR